MPGVAVDPGPHAELMAVRLSCPRAVQPDRASRANLPRLIDVRGFGREKQVRGGGPARGPEPPPSPVRGSHRQVEPAPPLPGDGLLRVLPPGPRPDPALVGPVPVPL